MRWVALVSLFVLALLGAGACSSSSDASAPKPVPDAAADADAGDAAADVDAGPIELGAQSYGDFQDWASPIDDYISIGGDYFPNGFNQAITELFPLGDRMFMGYGDGTLNLGEETPIEIRFFASPVDPAAAAAPIDGAGQGAPQTTPYQSGEEEIDRFRSLDGVLWQAGVDSIDADELDTQAKTNPKGIQGNVYDLQGDTWKKHRSVNGGEHVQDIGSFQGGSYAVGSGADTRTEFEAGQIFRYLWHSADQGVSFETVQRVQVTTAGAGDTRWVHLCSTSDRLFLFGYESDFATNTAKAKNAGYDGTSVADFSPSDPLGQVYPDGTLALPDGTCFLYGLAIASTPPTYTAGLVKSDGSFTPLPAFAGSTVLDVSVSDSDEIVFLVQAGDSYGDTPTSWDLRVLVADIATPDTVKELVHFTSSVQPTAIAGWKGMLVLGTDPGKVLRASPKP